MFDVGFSELVLIGVVALLVIGPERLPGVARTAGHLLGRLQRYVSEVKSDIGREMQLDELKQIKNELHDSVRGFEQDMQEHLSDAEQTFNEFAQSSQADFAELADLVPNHHDSAAGLAPEQKLVDLTLDREYEA